MTRGPFLQAVAFGIRRATGHPGLVLVLWLASVLVALPAAVFVGRALDASFGPTVVQDSMRRGFDMAWFGEFSSSARGLEATFGPGVIGGHAFLQNLEAWLTGRLHAPFTSAAAIAVVYALVWALLLGGVISRFAEPEGPFGPTRLVVLGGEYFFRFARLALLSLPLYWLVYRFHRWLYGRLGEATRETTVERTVLFGALAVVALTALLLVTVHVAFAYAKVATVLERRRGMIRAGLRGIGFVLRHPLRTLGLYAVMALASATVLTLFVFTAPGANQSSMLGVTAAFCAGQLILVARLVLRLGLLGAEIELYRELGFRPPAD